jgi:fatty acid/phospholipid biosynthesis enzyme
MGAGMLIGGFLALIIAATRIVLPYDESYLGVALGALPAINRLRKRMDYAEYGGGPVLGVQGIVVKAHGRSNARAIRSALMVAHQAVERDTMAAFAAIGAQPALSAEH